MTRFTLVVLTLGAALVMFVPATAQIPADDQIVQWMFALDAPPNSQNRITNAHVQWKWDHRIGEELPFTVPPGKCLGLTGAKLASKFGHSATIGHYSNGEQYYYDRSSYLVIGGIDTIVEHHPMQVWPQPVVLPPNYTLGGDGNPVSIINAASEAQQMLGSIFGVLRPCRAFTSYESYRSVFGDWFRASR